MKVSLAPQFKKKFKKLDPQLQSEVLERIKQFESDPEDARLHAHSLKGKLKGVYSFSVNYKVRILYLYLSEEEVVLLTIGTHDIYK